MGRLEVLEQTVAYYSEDVNRRCIDTKTNTCFYSGNTAGKKGISDGCAVGRLLPEELREELDTLFEDTGGASSVTEAFHLLPVEIKELGEDFLYLLQKLHDADAFWYEGGLTKEGKEAVQKMKQQFNLK